MSWIGDMISSLAPGAKQDKWDPVPAPLPPGSMEGLPQEKSMLDVLVPAIQAAWSNPGGDDMFTRLGNVGMPVGDMIRYGTADPQFKDQQMRRGIGVADPFRFANTEMGYYDLSPWSQAMQERSGSIGQAMNTHGEGAGALFSGLFNALRLGGQALGADKLGDPLAPADVENALVGTIGSHPSASITNPVPANNMVDTLVRLFGSGYKLFN